MSDIEITAADREAANQAYRDWTASDPSIDERIAAGNLDWLAKAFAKHRMDAFKQVAFALPDEIDLFRAIRGVGRKNSDKAAAVYALIPPVIRALTTNQSKEG
jgi:hypothetical protein